MWAACQDERPAESALTPGLSAHFVVAKSRLADLWPLTMIALALSVTVAWTGLLISLVWWGIEDLT